MYYYNALYETRASLGVIEMRNPGYSDWYKDIVNNAEMKPVEEVEAEVKK